MKGGVPPGKEGGESGWLRNKDGDTENECSGCVRS